jgi:hypothetical protein
MASYLDNLLNEIPRRPTVSDIFNFSPQPNVGAVSLPKAYRFLVDSTTDEAASTRAPQVVCGVVRWLSASTYDFGNRDGHNSDPQRTSDEAVADAIKQKVFFLEDFLVSGTINSNKSNYIHNISLSLVDANNQVMFNVYPDDWVFCCIVDGADRAQALRVAIQAAADTKSAINDPKNGLKFLGRINSITKSIQVTAEGVKSRRIQVSGTMFRELGSKIYYDPYYQRTTDTQLEGLTNMASQVVNLEATNDPILYEIDNYIPLMFSIFLGKGPGDSERDTPGNFDSARHYNGSFIIPKVIAGFFGSVSSNTPTYTDVIKYLGGNQHYDATGFYPVPNKDSEIPNLLVDPFFRSENNPALPSGFINRTDQPLDGRRDSAYMNPLTNEPLWSIVDSSVNRPINEMYTTLRLGPDGLIYPYIIARQVPLSTPFCAAIIEGTSQYYALPRWVIPDRLVMGLQVGRSSEQRANYVEVLSSGGISPGSDKDTLEVEKAAFPASIDFINMKANGVLPYVFQTVVTSSNINSAGEEAVKWTRLIADRVMSNHLRYSGSISCMGIFDPICIGDNLEFDNILYHIEDITHSFSRSLTGTISFSTNIGISNGLNIPESQILNTTEDMWPDFMPPTGYTNDHGPQGSTVLNVTGD